LSVINGDTDFAGEFAANGFVGARRFQIDYFSLSKFVAGIIAVLTEKIF
jgi:hypothetical protein